MADTTFVSKVTHIVRAWAQDVNNAVYRAIGAGGVAPTTPAEVRTNLGLDSTVNPTGASLIGSSGPAANVQQYMDLLGTSSGGSYIGAQPGGDLAGTTVQQQLYELETEKASLIHGNNWSATYNYGEQLLEYTIPQYNAASVTAHINGTTLTVTHVFSGTLCPGQIVTGAGVTACRIVSQLGGSTGATGTYKLTIAQSVGSEAMTLSSGGDGIGWGALVHNQDGGNTDAVVALVGHAYHDGAFSNTGGGMFGIATEAWSNPDGDAVLIGGELSVISQSPTNGFPVLGMNSVFKNRRDGATGPTAPIGDGSLYNFNSRAIFISSQQRPSDGIHTNVGSGWQTVMRIGDPPTVVDGDNSGLDWEGGQFYPGSDTYKAYSTIIDMTNALVDMAGGMPWLHLYKRSVTYFGQRFNAVFTGQLDTYNIKPNAAGAGYAAGDTGHITGGSGTGATYYVVSVTAGAVDTLAIILGGANYVATAAAATTATTGGGAGLTITITVGVGLIWGANISLAAGGAGYAVNDTVFLNGGTAGYLKPILKVTTVAAGAVTAFKLLSPALTPLNSARVYNIGRGHTVGLGKTTTAIGGAGAGMTVNIAAIHDDLIVGGEKMEFWRMLNPSDPESSGLRHGYIDMSFPGADFTIDTSAATYTFPVDRPL